jgi:hypothetical protein
VSFSFKGLIASLELHKCCRYGKLFAATNSFSYKNLVDGTNYISDTPTNIKVQFTEVWRSWWPMYRFILTNESFRIGCVQIIGNHPVVMGWGSIIHEPTM